MAEREEPLAVVGMACRFPGAPGIEEFWSLLAEGGDAVAPGTGDRAGRRPGGYVEGVAEFDAEFFGVPALEAAALDPQQRLLLELCWHAFEDARAVPGPQPGGPVGVFVGCCADDYARLSAPEGPGPFTMTGTTRAFLANRVSYALGLTGPSLVVDCGQSSSLVALHQAASALHRQECATALVAGVQLNLSADGDLVLEELGALSPTGRCRTFSAKADGIVRGEGAAVLVLKPLSAATRAGDRVYCTVLSSAVNNDGGGPGLTAPNRTAQRDVLVAAYRRAGIAPSTAAYVELHGTGTRVGDPVEARALGAVLGRGRPADAPLLVGSVKTNIGHLEGAAGLAGVVKTALALHRRLLPPTLHHDEPNPAIDLAGLGIEVCIEARPWPRVPGPLVAGVSGFGLGGTNCHVVLGEAPPTGERADVSGQGAEPGRALPFLLAARSEAALRDLAARSADLVEHGAAALVDLAYSTAATRAALPHRAAVVAAARGDLAARLRGLAEEGDPDGPDRPGVVSGTPAGGRVAFLFPGQGMQRLGMGRGLHGTYGVFARAFDEACAAAEEVLRADLKEALWERADLLDRMTYAQPALFALEVALHRLLESFGLVPDVLVGHSQGEVAAAHLAGVLSLADAAELVVHRGRLMSGLPRGGAMVAVQAAEDEVRELLAAEAGVLAVGALNGPRAVVVSGEEEAAERVAAAFRARGRRTRRLPIEIAAHSPLMRAAQDELEAVAGKLVRHEPTGPTIVSTVTGEPVDPRDFGTAAYWAGHLVSTVRFAPAVRTAHELGARFFVEIGPGPGLSTLAAETVGGAAETFSAPLAAGEETEGVAETLGAAFVRGVPVGWDAFFGPAAHRTDLPGYPFQRLRHWLDAAPPERAAAPRRAPWTGDHVALVTERTCAVLGRPAADLDLDATFTGLGLDSRMSVALRGVLARTLGRDLPTTLLFDHPTPAALIRALQADASHGPAPVNEERPW
ncbi:hypothetical protein GCM10022221_73160 [Actinocorallia aurea]